MTMWGSRLTGAGIHSFSQSVSQSVYFGALVVIRQKDVVANQLRSRRCRAGGEGEEEEGLTVLYWFN